MYKNFYNVNLFIILLILFIGILSLLVNFAFSYNLSLSRLNKQAHYASKVLDAYPRAITPLVFIKENGLSKKDLDNLGNWLFKDNNSMNKIIFKNEVLNIKMKYNNNINIIKIIEKILLMPNLNFKKIDINFKKELLEFSLTTS